MKYIISFFYLYRRESIVFPFYYFWISKWSSTIKLPEPTFNLSKGLLLFLFIFFRLLIVNTIRYQHILSETDNCTSCKEINVHIFLLKFENRSSLSVSSFAYHHYIVGFLRGRITLSAPPSLHGEWTVGQWRIDKLLNMSKINMNL